jgi:pimeloyl-ACP methyl ester carboxylesterase
VIHTNNIDLAYPDSGGEGPPLVMLHGLTANRHQFGGLLRAGLGASFRLIAPDLRGRGDSSKPSSGYTMADHAADITGLIEALGLEDVVLAGHSFGGMLTMYMGARCPARLAKLVLLDAALALAHPSVGEAIKPVLQRLDNTVPSVEAHLDAIRSLPMYTEWDDDMAAMYRAEVETLPDGTARPRSTSDAMIQAMDGVLAEDWEAIAQDIHLPAMLIRGTAPYGDASAPPLLRPEAAQATVEKLGNITYHEVGGNHISMLFGGNREAVARHITEFAC